MLDKFCSEARGKDKSGTWRYGNAFTRKRHGYTVTMIQEGRHTYAVYYQTIGMFTGLRDKRGQKIYKDDILLFTDITGAKWIGVVTFEDGLFTVSILFVVNIKNPRKWDMKHDWINSRMWSTRVGYGEYGSWNCPRTPLVQIALNFKELNEVEKLYDKYGRLGGRIINVTKLGNIFDQAFYLQKCKYFERLKIVVDNAMKSNIIY